MLALVGAVVAELGAVCAFPAAPLATFLWNKIVNFIMILRFTYIEKLKESIITKQAVLLASPPQFLMQIMSLKSLSSFSATIGSRFISSTFNDKCATLASLINKSLYQGYGSGRFSQPPPPPHDLHGGGWTEGGKCLSAREPCHFYTICFICSKGTKCKRVVDPDLDYPIHSVLFVKTCL